MSRRIGAALSLLLAVMGGRMAAQGSTTVRFDGFLQPRSEMVDDSAVFYMRRARVGLQGQVTNWAGYRLLTEWRTGTGSTTSLLDAYAQLTDRRLTFVLGQSKTPFSAGFLQNEADLEIPELPIVIEALVPNRDIGAKAEWRGSRQVTLSGGIFNGEGRNRTSNDNRRLLLVARAVVTVSPGFGIGASGAMEDSEDYLGVEAAYTRGPLELRGEYIRRTVGGGGGTTALGWYAFAGWTQRGGRWQIVGRVEQYDPDDSDEGDGLMAITPGAQWMLRGENVKLQLAYTVVTEEEGSIPNNRAVAQMQLRF